MNGIYILGCDEEFYARVKSEPRYFRDLNLDQIVGRIVSMRKDYDIRKYFYKLPDKRDVAVGRIEVLKALQQETLRDGLFSFSDNMQSVRFYREKYQEAQTTIQRQRYLLDCAGAYISALEALQAALDSGVGDSSFLSALKEEVREYTETEAYSLLEQETRKLLRQFAELRVQIVIEKDRIKASVEEQETGYIDRLRELFPDNVKGQEWVDNPFQGREQIGEMEILILETLEKNDSSVFSDLHVYAGRFKSVEHILDEGFLVLEQQLQVYLAFYLFLEEQKGSGYPFACPQFSEEQGDGTDWDEQKVVNGVESKEAKRHGSVLEVSDGYDLALYLKRYGANYRIVCNDVFMMPEEQFLVVTGPNQGGKTTFARSVGQIVYFSLMGLMAPCRSVRLPFFQGILTHFSVEESLETGRGKLKEELVRLKPMMRGEETNRFVVINELFTTAATYDAYIMGKKVMEHFMERDCLGIYVTHIQELADEEKIGGENRRIVSLSACVDKENPRQRTYQIRRRKADGIAHAYGLVEKYHLTYGELKTRLAERVTGSGENGD